MIERTSAFKVGEKTFATLTEAQARELGSLLFDEDSGNADSAAICNRILAHAEKVIDILSTKPTSKVRARKLNGGTKKRTPRTEPAPALTLK